MKCYSTCIVQSDTKHVNYGKSSTTIDFNAMAAAQLDDQELPHH